MRKKIRTIQTKVGRKIQKKTVIVVEEPALFHQTLPSTKKASPTLGKKTSVNTDTTRNTKQNEYA